jgi:hypothetical protein
MLAAVASIDAATISPVCLEIAQLCGRLPLCINIVGNLIRTFGSGWEQEVPDILRGDMNSLAENSRGASGEQNQPLNLQQRVISSGLESISGSDAPKIVSLFQGLAVFEEVRRLYSYFLIMSDSHCVTDWCCVFRTKSCPLPF